ncbi:MAG: hypothetical protein Hens3KO_06150 [Henriciella sp.]
MEICALSFVGFTGAAGCGKTHQLLHKLCERLREKPLAKGQKVLALTFMHGSRKRLDARLSGEDLSGAKFECTVIDKFAARILHRWRDLAFSKAISPFEDDAFDERCGAAALLLNEPFVRDWVVAEYPIVLLDEAQDLKPERLAIFEALEGHCELFVAADGFQCLDKELRDSEVLDWVNKNDRSEELDQVRRTEKAGLLAAAKALRSGDPLPLKGAGFRVLAHQKGPNLATPAAAMSLKINHWESAAIITPTMNDPHVSTFFERLQKNRYGPQKRWGPYKVRSDAGPEALARSLIDEMALPEVVDLADALAFFKVRKSNAIAKRVMQQLEKRIRVRGDETIVRQDLSELVETEAVETNRYAPSKEVGLQGMTVHAAKNREFDGVVAIWPYRVAEEPEQRRRLLYNAITRARQWCAVVCMNSNQLKQAPFI